MGSKMDKDPMERGRPQTDKFRAEQQLLYVTQLEYKS
jgi:hypothetical protein